jgi:hypothetical protein
MVSRLARNAYLLIPLSVAFLWVRSYWSVDRYPPLYGGTSFGFVSWSGRVILLRWHVEPTSPLVLVMQFSVTGEAAPMDTRTNSAYEKLSASRKARFSYGDISLRRASLNNLGGFESWSILVPPRFDMHAQVIPDWVFFVVSTIPYTFLVWPWPYLRRRRRLSRGHCPVCDYDLRANQGHCPECGNGIRKWGS